jgi:hypothetical protein
MDTQNPNLMAKKMVLIIVPGIVLGVLLYAGYLWNQRATVPEVSDLPPIEANAHNGLSYQNLLENSISFARAVQYAKDRNFALAREYYEKAKLETTDPTAQGIIMFQMAILTGDEGKYLESIDALKEIIAKADVTSPVTRAYAFLEMGLLFYKYADNAITDRIFAGDVYYKKLRDDDVKVTYRHLFEESARLYPLSLSELRIADWYVNEITLAEKGEKVLDPVKRPEYEKIIGDSLIAADADLVRIQNLPSEYARYGLPALLRKAIIVGKLNAIGNGSLGPVEAVFDKALNAYATRPGADGYVRYHYADALSNQPGEIPVAKIRTLLSPLYDQKEVYKTSSVLSFLKNERANVLNVKKDIVKLAKIDPKFKELLMSYGWKSSDF